MRLKLEVNKYKTKVKTNKKISNYFLIKYKKGGLSKQM